MLVDVRTLLAVLFVAAMAGVAGYLAQRPTIARGEVFAARMLENLQGKHVARVTCDDAIPIEHAGAVFRCEVAAEDGEAGLIEVTVDRTGSTDVKILDRTPGSRHATHDM